MKARISLVYNFYQIKYFVVGAIIRNYSSIETIGPICTEGKKFIFDVGKKIENISGEFLFQRISIAF